MSRNFVKNINHTARSAGFVLIEFTVGLAIGLFLITLLFNFYFSVYKTYRIVNNLAAMQENSRLALSLISQDIRMAGFIGCLSLANMHHPLQPINLTPQTSLQIWKTCQQSGLPASICQRHAKASDVIALVFASAKGRPIIKASSLIAQHPEQTWIISDCHNAQIFRGKYCNKVPYRREAEIRKLHRVYYYIAATGRKNATGDKIYALYRYNALSPKHNPTELVEGIEKITIRYGLFNEISRSIDYVDASEQINWKRLRSIALSLQVSSLERIHYNQVKQYAKQKWHQIIMLRAQAIWSASNSHDNPNVSTF